MTTEEVYDEQIFPLMKRIIEICQIEKIPIVAAFQIEDGGEPFYVSTVVNCDGDEAGSMMHQMAEAIHDDMRKFSHPSPLSLKTYDADGNLKQIETIIG